MENIDNIIIIPKKLEKETNNGKDGVKDGSFCVIDKKTNNVNIYYRVNGWGWNCYNQFVKFSLPNNTALANILKDKKNMKDVEDVIKNNQQQNNLLKSAYVSCLALKYNDKKQPPFDKEIIKGIENIQLNKIKADYFSEDFFDCADANETKRFASEPIIQILYENGKQNMYTGLLEEDWDAGAINHNYRKLLMKTLIERKTENLREEMGWFQELMQYSIKTTEELKYTNNFLRNENNQLKNSINPAATEYTNLKNNISELKKEKDKLKNDLETKEKNLKAIVKNNLINGDYKLQKRNNDSLFSCCVPYYDNIDEKDIENEVGGLFSKKNINKKSKPNPEL